MTVYSDYSVLVSSGSVCQFAFTLILSLTHTHTYTLSWTPPIHIILCVMGAADNTICNKIYNLYDPFRPDMVDGPDSVYYIIMEDHHYSVYACTAVYKQDKTCTR